MDRLERLVNLTAALLDADRALTRQEIRTRVGGYTGGDESFRRAFERDKDTLRQMGIPVVTEELEAERSDEQAGYRIPRDRYELPDPDLADDELAALRLAATLVRVEGGEDATGSALRKLAAAVGPTTGGVPTTGNPAAGGATAAVDGRRPVPTPGPVADLPGGDAVAVVFGAVAERRRLVLGYRGHRRQVDPWRLSYRGGQWYLAGWDHVREAERTFRLDRLEPPLEVVGPADAFAPPGGRAGRPAPPWRLGDEPEVMVDVLVDADRVPWAVSTAGPDAVVDTRASGDVVLRLPVTNRAALRSFVLGLLDHAEVLGPDDVRADMVAWLTGMARA